MAIVPVPSRGGGGGGGGGGDLAHVVWPVVPQVGDPGDSK